MGRRNTWNGWRRDTLGAIAGVLLLAALIMWVSAPNSAVIRSVVGVCLRVGLLLAALWLALPQITAIFERYPRWVWMTLAVAALVLLLIPSVLQLLIPLALIIAVLYYLGFFKNLLRR